MRGLAEQFAQALGVGVESAVDPVALGLPVVDQGILGENRIGRVGDPLLVVKRQLFLAGSPSARRQPCPGRSSVPCPSTGSAGSRA